MPLTTLKEQVITDIGTNYLRDAMNRVYANLQDRTEYHMKIRYGKYTIYRWEFKGGVRTSTTLAKKIDRELAEGMMKLLKETT